MHRCLGSAGRSLPGGCSAPVGQGISAFVVERGGCRLFEQISLGRRPWGVEFSGEGFEVDGIHCIRVGWDGLFEVVGVASRAE